MSQSFFSYDLFYTHALEDIALKPPQGLLLPRLAKSCTCVEVSKTRLSPLGIIGTSCIARRWICQF
ncbi:unnamed protein product [Brassica napus]|nr:unnamed protein product [Brassica napus]